MPAAILPLLLFVSLPWSNWGKEAEVWMTLRSKAGAGEQARLLDETVRTVRQRLKLAGIDADVKLLANGDISAHVPAILEPERVRKLVQRTGLLEFRLVRFPKGGGGAESREELLSSFTGDLPAELEILEGGGRYYVVERQPAADGHGILSARPTMGLYDKPIVAFELTPEAAEVFGQVTGDNAGSGLAIVFDRDVLSAPVINGRIGGSGIIEGDFTREEVQDMAAMMASGPLPSEVSIVDEKVVRPSPAARHARRVTFGGAALGVVVAAALFGLALRRR